MSNTAVIYSITNTINGKSYIGSSMDIKSRFRCHKHNLNNNKHDNNHLQNAWSKYGKDTFKFEILETFNNITNKELIDIEQQYLDVIKLMPCRYYNISMNAEIPGMIGRKHTEITKQKISNKLKEVFPNGRTDLKQSWVNRKSKGLIKSHFNPEIKKFKNRLTGEIYEGMQSDFINKYNLKRPEVTSLIKGYQKSAKNWILI